MRRTILYDEIGNVSFKLKTEVEKLKTIQSKLLNDIPKINDAYRGSDATLLISKYQERVNSIKSYINVIETYTNYFEWISGSYKDTHEEVVNDLSEEIPDQVNVVEEHNLLNIDDNVLNEEIEDFEMEDDFKDA